MTVIVTGAAGFIGFFVAKRLLSDGYSVVGVDNFNAYYEPTLKEARAAVLQQQPNFRMSRMDIAQSDEVARVFDEVRPTHVIHLAAQAGVRYSLQNPFSYERSNLAGHLSVLEACRQLPELQHLVYASSSSVYGNRQDGGAFREDDNLDAPASLYAATKRACELMSQSYASLYKLPQTGLRFFTAYGPWGRPDMAYFSFTRKILANEPIEVFGEGNMARDFTYIDDIVDGTVGVLARPPRGGHQLFNIGDSSPVPLLCMIETLEQVIGVKARKVMLPMQPGDVTATFADVSRLKALIGYMPRVRLEEGLTQFVSWYRTYYGG